MNNDNFENGMTPKENIPEDAETIEAAPQEQLPAAGQEPVPPVVEPVTEEPTQMSAEEPVSEESLAEPVQETAGEETTPVTAQEPSPQPQQPVNQHPYGYQMPPQPAPQPRPYHYPYGAAQQPYQSYGQPYQQRIHPYPPYAPPKPKMPAGVKALIICMAVLTVIGFTGFGIAISMNSTDLTQNGGFSYEELPGDGFYGYYDEFENAPDEESSQAEEGLAIDPADQPDIEIPEDTNDIVINSRPKGEELTAQQVYEKVLPSTVTVDVDVHYTDGTTEDSTGTGIFISEDGFLITNSHVVANSKSVEVKIITSDGTEHPAVVVGLDKTTDLAVLKVDGTGFIPAEFGSSDELSIGEWVIAIGNPGGTEFTGSLTRGVISGLDRSVGSYSANGMTYIQTDAAINPGNSGGPLVNMHGQVIGINSSKIVADYYEGMGFAIPSSKAKDIIDQLLTDGYVKGRVRLGITGQNVLYGYPEGITIIAIDENSSFAGTKAKVGDVITAINGTPVASLTELANEFLLYAPGDTVTVTLYRDGSEFDIDIVLLEDKGETQR